MLLCVLARECSLCLAMGITVVPLGEAPIIRYSGRYSLDLHSAHLLRLEGTRRTACSGAASLRIKSAWAPDSILSFDFLDAPDMFPLTIAVAASALSWIMGVYAATDMGPAAFLWPPDRAWAAAQDNTAPCGSSTGVVNRTEFPLANGALAVILQDTSFEVKLAVAYGNNPTSNDNFTTIVSAAVSADLEEIDPGHECYAIPNPPADVAAGSNGTFQLSYTSEDEQGANATFYACADVRFVELASFTTRIPCFNATTGGSEEGDPDPAGHGGAASSSAAGGATAAPVVATTSGGGISNGAIAGAVVGSALGAAVIAAVAFLVYRNQNKKDARQRAIMSQTTALDAKQA
ncbi:hypothetical protein MKEN_01461800 [Mycena kentingensis (nom. inval.)]|nr:hypothetical protein MKEN_01461800 [Mycena kentingensis (nom. inval.)]